MALPNQVIAPPAVTARPGDVERYRRLMTKLVLVADTPWVANEVKAALSMEGWQYIEVSDPRQTVATVEEARPAVVLIDLQVGSMGGMAVVRDLRQRLSFRTRTVMLLDRSADRFLARRAGADASVVKPFQAAELRRAVSGDEGEEE